ncbi:hypothetical protein RJ640_000755 [Escallonia rubra]|uniref:Transposase (putative) gypsy type domain-containing protein n=1 Tax=Escallonia rubra TaxID=112253 RepID=A0AA88U611_9ASTE|nr:hypothetical protein RJ640_000755 [Escallonia rubra]
MRRVTDLLNEERNNFEIDLQLQRCFYGAILRKGDVKDQAEDKANPKPWYTTDENSGPANYGTKFETWIYEEQVKSGYRLHLHPFAIRFFEHYRMAPGQLVPNGWSKLAGLIYLGGPKSNKGWHSRYFFIGRLDKGELPFDRNWNPYCKDFENPGKPTPNNLTKHILSHIKLRGGLSIDESLSKEQLEWAKIIPSKPIPAGFLIPPPPPAVPSVSSVETIPLAKGKRKEKQPSVELPLSPKKTRVTPPERSPRILEQVSIDDDPIFRPIWTLRRDDLGMPDSQMYASGSKMLSRFEMARQVAAEEAQQKKEVVKEAEEVIHRAEELSKQEADHLAQITTLEKKLERAKRRAVEEAKEMFAERFLDIPFDDFVLPTVVSPSRETAMPSEAGDAVASHLPGEGPSGDAPEP